VLEDAEARELLVGPDSVTWRFASDARLYLVMLYPLLLQVAHPTVGAGVRDFSDFDDRPWQRLLRTLDYVSLLVYGGEDAIAGGRRLRTLHKGFKGVREDGERYYALEPDAYAWVHATLLHGYVAGHQQFGHRMNWEETETFYREYRNLGRLIGVRPRDLPDTWSEFLTYFDWVSRNELVITDSVTRVLRSVQMAGPPPLPMPDPLWRMARLPARRALWIGGIGLLAPDLRRRLDIPWSTSDERAFRSLGALTRAMTPVMPKRLQILGPDQLRMRRRAIARGPLGPAADTTGGAPAPARRAVATS
jgi:uncharacterized protein (DUF2236 family)